MRAWPSPPSVLLMAAQRAWPAPVSMRLVVETRALLASLSVLAMQVSQAPSPVQLGGEARA
jgi:hypothetical protein